MNTNNNKKDDIKRSIELINVIANILLLFYVVLLISSLLSLTHLFLFLFFEYEHVNYLQRKTQTQSHVLIRILHLRYLPQTLCFVVEHYHLTWEIKKYGNRKPPMIAQQKENECLHQKYDGHWHKYQYRDVVLKSNTKEEENVIE